MLDIKYLVDNLDHCKEVLAHRNGKFDVDLAVSLYNKRRLDIAKVEELKAKRNSETQSISVKKRAGQNADAEIADMKILGDEIKALDEELEKVENELKEAMLSIPNITDSSVPYGNDDSENVVKRVVGTPRQFDFAPKAHWDIGEEKNILDFATGAKVSGARFTFYRGMGARLERAIMNFMMDTHSERGYLEILPPYLVNRESMIGTGQLPKFEEDMYAVKNENYYLIPTAEVPVTNMARNDVLEEDTLPQKFCAYSACFRGEAGSAGRDTRGLIRQHQFNKVELVKYARPDNSYDELEALTNDAEEILKRLGLPYRVMTLCSGDVGFSSAKTYDLEVWMPSYNRYVEISSCSNFEDYQARRANIRYRNSATKKLEFIHTLNGSGLAVGRTTAAILENYQNADGSITVPEVLVPYMRCEKF
ncbi:MAG: serine--tRNA ligase [Clostridia bacterium]